MGDRGWGERDLIDRTWRLAVTPFGLLTCIYVVFRVVGFLEAEPRVFNDTGSYENVADDPIFGINFLAGGRAPTLPLLFKVVHGNDLRVWANLAISIACWLALAGSLAVSIRREVLRVVAFAAVLLLALSPEVVLWDATLLSESISISLTAALVACWLWILRSPSVWSYGLMLVLAGAWTLARDPHAYVLAALALALAVSIPLDRAGGTVRLRAAAIAGLVSICAVSAISANAHFARWMFPLQNVISLRIATQPGQLAYFEDAGMPVTPELLDQMERFRESDVIPFDYPPAYDDPETLAAATPFHRWLRTRGRQTYTRFLLTHPGVVAEGFDHLGETLLDPQIAGYASPDSPWSASPLSAILYQRTAALTLVFAALSLALGAFAWLEAGPRREWAVPGFLIAVSLPFAILVHHGGALEPDRHGVVPALFLHMGALLLLLLAADHWLSSARGPATGRPAARSR